MEWLSTLFFGAFLVGLLFCIVSVLLGLGHGGLDHFHFGGIDAGGADGAHGGHAGGEVSPWNLTGLTAFVAWFGGVGYLALIGWQLAAWTSLLLAALAGLVGWAIVFLFFRKVLLRTDSELKPEDFQLEGVVARVSLPIEAGRIGEIQYSRAGTRRSESARSLDGSAIDRGAEVVVARYEQGIAYVQPWQEFVESEAPRGA